MTEPTTLAADVAAELLRGHGRPAVHAYGPNVDAVRQSGAVRVIAHNATPGAVFVDSLALREGSRHDAAEALADAAQILRAAGWHVAPAAGHMVWAARELPEPAAGGWSTLTVVVDTASAPGVLDALRHHDAVRFATVAPGVSRYATEAGADPSSWTA